jgi:CRISPR-associated endonuclease Csn1
MENNGNISFGIDLGIASIGWSVLDLDNNIIKDKGIYLFTEAEKAENRRILRGTRRRKKRKKHREERIYEILKRKNIYLKNTVDSNLLEVRLKSLKEKIEMQDIINIIFYFSRHRGYIPFKDEDERKSEIVDELRNENYLACEIQNEIYKNNKQYRGDEYLMQHSDYMKELHEMLEEQSKYYSEIDEEFIQDIEDIINSKRKFWEGPGGPRENQLNKYGRYRTLDDLIEYNKNKNYHKYLFEDLIGNCSVYANEKKASAWNFYAECFNFYNDIVNLRIDGQDLDETNKNFFEVVSNNVYKLKAESIQNLKDVVLNSKSVNYNNLFRKIFNIDFDKIYGYKKNSEGNAEICKFEKIRSIKNKLEDEDMISELLSDMDAYNKAIYLIQVSPDRQTRYEILKDNLSNIYSEKLLTFLSNCNLENKYHSFSEKALKKYLELMQVNNENSSYIERNFESDINSDVEEELIRNYIGENIEKGNLKYINSKYVEDIVASPATKKSLRKAISIINKLFSKYGYPNYICVENTRDLLTEKKQKEYEAKTLENQSKRTNAKKKLKEQGYEENDTNIDKYMLLDETNFKCAYCNKDITVANCEVEHILPRSITANDTFLNKTVSCSQCNGEKNNRTPYEYLMSIGMYSDYKERVIKNKKFVDEKKNNLLFEQNLNKYEKNFKNRNLNDTAYATNELANQLNIFKKAYLRNNYGEFLDFKVLKVPGQFTGIIRKKANLDKNRDLDYHHAVDATIVASIPKLKIGKLISMIQNEPDKYWKINNLNEYRESLYEDLYLNKDLKEDLLNADFSNTRAVREVTKKATGPLFDANISKVIIKDDQYYKIEQIDNIYNIMPADFEKEFNQNKYFLCKDNNPELYDRLFKIVELYSNKSKKVNPFVEYCKENNVKDGEKFDYLKHGIRQSNNPNSSVVVRLRFLQKVNNPYIISNKKLIKSNRENKKEILLMYDSLKSYCTRVYRDIENGKLYFMPIYKIFIDNNSGEIRTDSDYYKKVYNECVKQDIEKLEKYMDIYNNEYVRFENKKGEVAEGLVSYYDKSNNKIEIKKTSKNITANTVKIEKIKSDVLGLYNLNF